MSSESQAKRVAIEGGIDLRFPNFEGLVSGVSANLSASGMFIKSSNPEATGTEFSFALRIEEWSPIQGTAKVIWTRPVSESPERPAGMGVQFLEVDAQSRRMIRWLVDKHVEGGGKPFDVQTVPAGASRYRKTATRANPSRVSTKASISDSSTTSQHPGRSFKNRMILGAVAFLIVVIAGFGIYRWGLQGAGQPNRFKPVASRGSLQGADPAGPDSPGDSIRVEVETLAEAVREEIALTIQSWSDAWEARDPAAVVEYYAEDFEPADRGGREQWEAHLQRQLDDLEFVRVALSAMEIEISSPTTAHATFFRSFRSNLGDTSQRLRLELTHLDSSWKIQSEEILD